MIIASKYTRLEGDSISNAPLDMIGRKRAEEEEIQWNLNWIDIDPSLVDQPPPQASVWLIENKSESGDW